MKVLWDVTISIVLEYVGGPFVKLILESRITLVYTEVLDGIIVLSKSFFLLIMDSTTILHTNYLSLKDHRHTINC